MSLPAAHKTALLALARAAIRQSLASGERPRARELAFELALDPALARPAASFVTLHLDEKLRGCMGSLAAEEPLYENVALNAYRAAFRDPRFSPLTGEEFERLHVHVAVLGPLEPLSFADEDELLSKLRPGRDGLLIRNGQRQATFLPSVWSQLKEPGQFLAELKRKAQLPVRGRLPELEAFRYTTESFPEG